MVMQRNNNRDFGARKARESGCEISNILDMSKQIGSSKDSKESFFLLSLLLIGLICGKHFISDLNNGINL